MFKIACVILVATLSFKGDYLASELAEEEEAKLPFGYHNLGSVNGGYFE
jgi:hypothetical protein